MRRGYSIAGQRFITTLIPAASAFAAAASSRTPSWAQMICGSGLSAKASSTTPSRYSAARKTSTMALKLDQLATFVHVADLGSFTAAADKEGLTQPAVSLQVKGLEQRLGVRLIERVGRRAQPTAAGLDLLAHARRLLQDAAAAEEAMMPHRDGASGRVRIGSGGTASIHLLPRAISAARKSMPGLEITVHIGNADDVLRDLEANSLDIAVIALPASGRNLEIEPFYEEELLAVAPAGSRMTQSQAKGRQHRTTRNRAGRSRRARRS